MKQIVGLVLILCCTQMVAQEVFPDGKAIPEMVQGKQGSECECFRKENRA